MKRPDHNFRWNNGLEETSELLHLRRPIFIFIVTPLFHNLRVLGGLGKFSSLLPHVLVNDLHQLTYFLGCEEREREVQIYTAVNSQKSEGCKLILLFCEGVNVDENFDNFSLYGIKHWLEFIILKEIR